MADQDHGAAAGGVLAALGVDLDHQRAGRVDRVQLAGPGVILDILGDAMRAEDGDGAGRHFVQFFHKLRTLASQPFDHVLVVHDFVSHEHRGSVFDEGAVYNLDRAHDASTKTTGLSKNHLHKDRPPDPVNGFSMS